MEGVRAVEVLQGLVKEKDIQETNMVQPRRKQLSNFETVNPIWMKIKYFCYVRSIQPKSPVYVLKLLLSAGCAFVGWSQHNVTIISQTLYFAFVNSKMPSISPLSLAIKQMEQAGINGSWFSQEHFYQHFFNSTNQPNKQTNNGLFTSCWAKFFITEIHDGGTCLYKHNLAAFWQLQIGEYF